MKDVVAFLSGVLVGGAVALLVAPESGEETRQKLKKQAKKVQKDLDVQTAKSMEQLQEARKRSVEKLNEIKHSTEEMVENAAKRLNNKADDLAGAAEEAFAATDLG